MKTSINIFNLCTHCACQCKYCLLSYDRTLLGVDYYKGLDYAIEFKKWLNDNHPDVDFSYYFGYSMDSKYILESFDKLKSVNSNICEFMQFNGMKFRDNNELTEYLKSLKALGVKLINLTFYGLKKTHDAFADRLGDFDYLLRICEACNSVGLEYEAGVSITKENINEIDELVALLLNYTNNINIFTPHCGGRGISIMDKKITVSEYESLNEVTKKYLNREKNKTQEEWLNSNISTPNNRCISLSLLPTNIDNTNYEEVYNSLLKLDEDFYNLIPDFKALLQLYCDKTDDKLYSMKDLYACYRRFYIMDHNLNKKNIDERYSFSIRY